MRAILEFAIKNMESSIVKMRKTEYNILEEDLRKIIGDLRIQIEVDGKRMRVRQIELPPPIEYTNPHPFIEDLTIPSEEGVSY